MNFTIMMLDSLLCRTISSIRSRSGQSGQSACSTVKVWSAAVEAGRDQFAGKRLELALQVAIN